MIPDPVRILKIRAYHHRAWGSYVDLFFITVCKASNVKTRTRSRSSDQRGLDTSDIPSELVLSS